MRVDIQDKREERYAYHKKSPRLGVRRVYRATEDNKLKKIGIGVHTPNFFFRFQFLNCPKRAQ